MFKEGDPIRWEHIGSAPAHRGEKYGVVAGTDNDSLFHAEMLGDFEDQLRAQARKF